MKKSYHSMLAAASDVSATLAILAGRAGAPATAAVMNSPELVRDVLPRLSDWVAYESCRRKPERPSPQAGRVRD
jgi:hypothetical protein